MTNTDVKLHPQVLWAQREDILYVTIALADIRNESVQLRDDGLGFEATAGPEGLQYAVDMTFYAPILPSESKSHKTGQHLEFILKKQTSGPYWPRLLAASGKQSWLKTDFNKWKDEDDDEDPLEGQDQPGMADMGGMPGGMGGMGGMDFASMMGGGMGGMDLSQLMSQMQMPEGGDFGEEGMPELEDVEEQESTVETSDTQAEEASADAPAPTDKQ